MTSPLVRLGAAAAAVEGLCLLCLTVWFGVLFPSEGVSTPTDFGDATRYLPVVAAHPSWFIVPAWVLGLGADAIFLVALVAMREVMRPVVGGWSDVVVLFALVGVILYLVGHVVNVAWAPALIADVAASATVTPSTAAQYTVLSRIYSGAMLGGTFFTGIALVVLGATCMRTCIFSRGFGGLAIAAGAFDTAIVVAMLPPALPLTGLALVWLGTAMWRSSGPSPHDSTSPARRACCAGT